MLPIYYLHSQDKEDPSVTDVVSDAVKRHPNLVEATLGWNCSLSLTKGVVKGVLQKTDVRKVDVMTSWNTILDHSETIDVMGPECECMHVCVVPCSVFI